MTDDVFTTTMPVAIDIKPASINIKKQSLITVAILSTEDFDAPGEIVKDSLTLGAQGMKQVWLTAIVGQKTLIEMDSKICSATSILETQVFNVEIMKAS